MRIVYFNVLGVEVGYLFYYDYYIYYIIDELIKEGYEVICVDFVFEFGFGKFVDEYFEVVLW